MTDVMTEDAPSAPDLPPPPPPADAAAAADKERTNRIELFAAILLGIAAVLTAASAYRAALLDGDALKGYTESSKLETEAADQNSLGDQIQASDENIFLQYAVLATDGNQEEGAAAERANYILDTLARDELKEAIQWWSEQPDGENAPKSPFVDENPVYARDDYNPGWNEANALQEKADKRFNEGEKADDQGDIFELASVFFAGTLFFAGIAVVFRSGRMPFVLLIISCCFLVLGTYQFINAWSA